MNSETFYAWATLVAIFVGPVVAVLLARWIEKVGEKKRRKFDLFKTLMQTRGIRIDPAHVAALNVIELEFYEHSSVRSAFKTYIEHLHAPQPEGSDDQDRFFNQRSDNFMDLIHEIGKVVGYSFDKRELDRRSYVPRGWDDDQYLHRKNAHMLGQLLEGQIPLPVSNFISPNTSKFPAPPKVEG